MLRLNSQASTYVSAILKKDTIHLVFTCSVLNLIGEYEIKSEIRSIEIPFDVFCNKILQTVIHATRMMIGLKPQCLHHEILLDTGEWLCRVVSTPATTINLHVR